MDLIGLIPCAGRGVRLGNFSNHKPKCLLELNGITLLQNAIVNLKSVGVNEVIVVVNIHSKKIEDYISKNDFGVPVFVVQQPILNGLPGAIYTARDYLKGCIVMHLPDNIFTSNYINILNNHLSISPVLTVGLERAKPRFDRSCVSVNNGRLISLSSNSGSFVVPGIYVFNKNFVDICYKFLEDNSFNQEIKIDEIMRSIIDNGQDICGVEILGKRYDITSIEDIKNFLDVEKRRLPLF